MPRFPSLSLRAPAAFVEKKRAALPGFGAYGRIGNLFQARPRCSGLLEYSKRHQDSSFVPAMMTFLAGIMLQTSSLPSLNLQRCSSHLSISWQKRILRNELAKAS
jgi:hypothetical protein